MPGERLNAGLGDRLRLPARRGVARWAAVALLLALAAGVLYATPEPGGGAVACPDRVSLTPIGAPPSGTQASAAVPPLAIPAGMTGVTVRLAEPAVAAVLRAGSRVDLTVVATTMAPTLAGVLVLAVVPGVAFDEPGAAALLVALPDNQAQVRPNDAEYQVVVRTT